LGAFQVLVRRKANRYDKYWISIRSDCIETLKGKDSYTIEDEKVIGNNITGYEIKKIIRKIDIDKIRNSIVDLSNKCAVWVDLDDVERVYLLYDRNDSKAR